MGLFSGLFARKTPFSLDGFVDWHSHILPGVDDGVEDIEDSLAILAKYQQAGITDVWLTPHIMEDVPNRTDHLRSRFDQLKERYNGTVKLHLAAENMMDNLFLERLAADDLLPIGPDGKTLLVETSYYNAPIRLAETFKAIQAKGYYPLFAHPERYNYIQSLAAYKELKGKGIRFQLNLMSLAGHYGPAVKEKAEKLLLEGMYDCIGSDLHRPEHLDVLGHIKVIPQQMQRLNHITTSQIANNR